ncbi:cell division control protein 2 homolog [Cornus florida]|uniref:cell division control protein 2 homolog n=1 Tax=Cornus florida TaxID=4283 RepID=UPI00289CCDC5|nr:cell division control protein 2 homolog [Cornus florida]
MAPEVMKQSENTFASDIWSVGCIFAEMCKQEPLFVGSTPWEVVKRIFSLLGKPDERIWPGGTPLMETGFLIEDNPKNFAELFPNLEAAGVDLLSKMVCYTDRITVYDALNHPYFEER